MKNNLLVPGLLITSFFLNSCKCESDKEGCTDENAHNFDFEANINSDCEYRYISSIDISNVSAVNASGTAWDEDDSGPDVKINFGKSTDPDFLFTTNVAENQTSASLVPVSKVQFTTGEWKYQLVDEDGVGSSQVIAAGTFYPFSTESNSAISFNSGNILIQFNYAVH